MLTIQRRIAAAALAALTAITISGCGSTGEVKTPAPLPGASLSSLKIGISFDQPGLGLKTGNSYEGFDVDTATYVAAALGVSKDEITWVEANPADREKLITDGEVDLVFSTYSITDDRKKEVDFAGPYFVAHQDLLVRRNEEDIRSPQTLNGRTLCSVSGTTSSAYIKDRYKGKITLQEYPKYSDCVSALAASTVDAVTTDDVILAGFAATSQYKGKLRLVGRGFTDEQYGVGIKKGNTDLAGKVNTALQQYIDDGSWKRSLQNNVGPSGYSIPSPPSPGS
jgi:glutamate transport system substrate-binding protein